MSYKSKFYFLSFIFEQLNKLFPSRPHDRMAEMLPVTSQQQIKLLDLCTGTGYGARIIAKRYPRWQVTGIDLSKDMLEVGQRIIEAEKLSNINLLKCNAAALHFDDASFDLVTIAFGLHELPTAVRNAAVKECLRVLKPGGQILVADLNKPDSWNRGLVTLYMTLAEPAYAQEILQPGLENLLQQTGFTITERRYGLGGFIQYITAMK